MFVGSPRLVEFPPRKWMLHNLSSVSYPVRIVSGFKIWVSGSRSRKEQYVPGKEQKHIGHILRRILRRVEVIESGTAILHLRHISDPVHFCRNRISIVGLETEINLFCFLKRYYSLVAGPASSTAF
jgi:hypothetical protein